MDEVNKIVSAIKKGDLKPIYFLMGEEPYYIDKIADFIAENVLREEEKSFNHLVLYGRDVSIEDIVSNAKRFPMMAEKQVIIVKEAQDLFRNIEKLADYVENPQPSTVLVICYKYKIIDKRKKLYKSIAKVGVTFEGRRMYEDRVADWIRKMLAAKDYQIAPKAAQMLVEFLGNDLSKVENELNKLQLICKPGSMITPEIIEKNIGISKDFNNFELRKAIGSKDSLKAHRIINYFGQNPKDNPMVVTVSLLFSFFSQILQYHGLTDKSKANVAKTLKINPYFVSEFTVAAGNYPMKKASRAISAIRETDMQGKGVGAANVPQGDLLKELLVNVMQ
ncbi:MAG TPA: DNA polymerase III subunit delta [Salinimicrobium sp.]|nr:DNA polymerase III subunit delta [Salinimicrobium sp.]